MQYLVSVIDDKRNPGSTEAITRAHHEGWARVVAVLTRRFDAAPSAAVSFAADARSR